MFIHLLLQILKRCKRMLCWPCMWMPAAINSACAKRKKKTGGAKKKGLEIPTKVKCLWHTAQLQKVINTGNLCIHKNVSNLSNIGNQKIHWILVTMVTFATKVVINICMYSRKVPVTFIHILPTLYFLNKNLTSWNRGIPCRQEDRQTDRHTDMTKLMAVLHNYFVNMPTNNSFLLI